MITNNKLKKIVLLTSVFFAKDLNSEQIDKDKEKSVDCSTPNELISTPSKLSLIKEQLAIQDRNQDLGEDLDDDFDEELEGVDESLLEKLLQDGEFMDSLKKDSENGLSDDQVKEFLELIKSLSESQADKKVNPEEAK